MIANWFSILEINKKPDVGMEKNFISGILFQLNFTTVAQTRRIVIDYLRSIFEFFSRQIIQSVKVQKYFWNEFMRLNIIVSL